MEGFDNSQHQMCNAGDPFGTFDNSAIYAKLVS